MADANKLIQDNTNKINANAKAWAKVADPVNKANEALKVAVDVQKQFNEQLKNAKTSKEFATAQKQIEGNIKAVSLAEKEAIEVQKKAQQLERERIKTGAAHAREKDRVARATSKLNSLYKQESARLTELRNKAKDMAINLIRLTNEFGKDSVQVKKATKEFAAMQSQVNKLDTSLKKIDSSLGQNQRNVGNYTQGIGKLRGGLTSLAGAFGFAGGIQLFASALKGVVKISKDYEKSNAVLASVLGKTRKETVKLQRESRRLGGSTAFSASQVTALQTSLARLGKTENEIIAMTEGVINASIALGSGAEETAELVGSTMNAFKLGAEESGRVADVLTLSTQRSALSFEKLSTALPIVAGAASAMGVPMEKLISQLAQAADRGIDASSSATALRNIYLKAKASGLTYAQAIEEVKKAQDGLTKSNELFGVRASVVGVTLADTTKNAEELEIALLDAGDTAERVAREQMNTLHGALTEQDAAWEALALSIADSETAIGGFARSSTIALTGLIKGFTRLNTSSKALAGSKADEFMRNVALSVAGLGEDVSDTEKVRNSLNAWMVEYQDNVKRTELVIKRLSTKGGLAAVLDVFTTTGAIKFLSGTTAALQDNRNALVDTAGGYGLAADKIKELLGSEEALAAFLQSIKDDAAEAKKAAEAAAAAAEAKAKAAALELARGKDLIKLKQAEIKAARDTIATTNEELGVRNRKVQVLQEELAVLRELGIIKDPKKVKAIDEDTFRKNELSLAKEQQKELDALLDEELEDYFDKEDAKTEKLKEEAAKRKEVLNQGKELAINTAGAILANSIATNALRVDDEIVKNREELNTNLADESLNEDQRAVLRAEAKKREDVLKLKRVKAERKDALFRIGINTAVAVVKTLATLGIPAGIIPAAAAAAAGLAEAAVVSAKPLPKFDKGTKSAPTGGFWAGEKRGEFMINDGKVSYIDKPTMFGNDYAGAEIISSANSATILDNISRNEAVNNIEGHNKEIAAQMLDLAMLKLETRNQTRAIVGAINGNQQSALDKMRERNYNNGINKHRS